MFLNNRCFHCYGNTAEQELKSPTFTSCGRLVPFSCSAFGISCEQGEAAWSPGRAGGSSACGGAALRVGNGAALLRNVRECPYSETGLTVPAEGNGNKRPENNQTHKLWLLRLLENVPVQGPASKYWVTAVGFCPLTGFVRPDTEMFSRSVCFQRATAAIVLHL